MGFFSKQIRLGGTIKPLATGPFHRVRSVKHSKTNRMVFPWITDDSGIAQYGLTKEHSTKGDID